MTWIVDQECDILTKGYGFSEPTRLDPNHLKEKFIPEIIMSKFNILFKFKYFDLVLDPKDSEWTFNDVGFIKARIRILYSTLRQYVALFGSPLPVEGYSGCYTMEVSDIVLWNTMCSAGCQPQNAVSQEYGPGDISVLRSGEKRIYTMDNTYMINVGIGNIVESFNQGIIHPAFVDRDFGSAFEQLKTDIKAVEKSSCSIL